MTYKIECVLFDLDGTLANVRHRLHFVETPGQKKDWPAFFGAMIHDTVIESSSRLYWALYKARYRMFILTGRPEEYRSQTENWLRGAVGHKYHELIMRKTGDYRQDFIVKKEMLDALRARDFAPVLSIDDRPSVVRMWRENGVPCFQADDSTWNEGNDGIEETTRD